MVSPWNLWKRGRGMATMGGMFIRSLDRIWHSWHVFRNHLRSLSIVSQVVVDLS